jgi:hypothetical protein
MRIEFFMTYYPASSPASVRKAPAAAVSTRRLLVPDVQTKSDQRSPAISGRASGFDTNFDRHSVFHPTDGLKVRLLRCSHALDPLLDLAFDPGTRLCRDGLSRPALRACIKQRFVGEGASSREGPRAPCRAY